MQVGAHRPQEVEGPDERLEFPGGEFLQANEFGRTVGRVEVLGDPEQGVEVA